MGSAVGPAGGGADRADGGAAARQGPERRWGHAERGAGAAAGARARATRRWCRGDTAGCRRSARRRGGAREGRLPRPARLAAWTQAGAGVCWSRSMAAPTGRGGAVAQVRGERCRTSPAQVRDGVDPARGGHEGRGGKADGLLGPPVAAGAERRTRRLGARRTARRATQLRWTGRPKRRSLSGRLREPRARSACLRRASSADCGGSCEVPREAPARRRLSAASGAPDAQAEAVVIGQRAWSRCGSRRSRPARAGTEMRSTRQVSVQADKPMRWWLLEVGRPPRRSKPEPGASRWPKRQSRRAAGAREAQDIAKGRACRSNRWPPAPPNGAPPAAASPERAFKCRGPPSNGCPQPEATGAVHEGELGRMEVAVSCASGFWGILMLAAVAPGPLDAERVGKKHSIKCPFALRPVKGPAGASTGSAEKGSNAVENSMLPPAAVLVERQPESARRARGGNKARRGGGGGGDSTGSPSSTAPQETRRERPPYRCASDAPKGEARLLLRSRALRSRANEALARAAPRSRPQRLAIAPQDWRDFWQAHAAPAWGCSRLRR